MVREERARAYAGGREHARHVAEGSYPIHLPRSVHRRRKARSDVRLIAFLFLLLPGAGVFASCQTAPVTGRQGFNVFSLADDMQLGNEAFEQVVSESQLVTSGKDKRMVERVMRRLVAVSDDPGFEWSVVLIDDPETVNAFALPGGKMAVYSGILPVCADETGLAVVMGHEIGHVVSRHGTERMTQAVGFEIGFMALNAGEYEDLGRQLLDMTVSLPFSRSHESDADHVGLIYMARAGYDPREALAFWRRMDEMSAGGGPEFMSTHPSHETRVTDLETLLPQAMAEWQAYKDRKKGAKTNP